MMRRVLNTDVTDYTDNFLRTRKLMLKRDA